MIYSTLLTFNQLFIDVVMLYFSLSWKKCVYW